MKSFLKYFLANFLALLLAILFFLVILFSILASFHSPKTNIINKNSVLVIDLSNGIQEKANDELSLNVLSGQTSHTTTILQTIHAIQKAKTDDKIKGMVLYYSEPNVSLANLEELRTELLHFKSNGKFIYAFGDKLNLKNMYIASVADQLYVNPVSFVLWKGLSSRLLYFKNTLDKLEIEMQIFYQGKFKSATEPFRNESMSEENRVQMQEIVTYLYNFMLETICAQRNIAFNVLNTATSELKIATAQDALRIHLVDYCETENQFQHALKQKLGIKATDDIEQVSLADYVEKITHTNISKGSKIAVVYAEGDIMDNDDFHGNYIQEKKYLKIFKDIEKDNDIKGVVLRINSPGGDSKASDRICQAIKQLKIAKPIIVSMSSVAASGGYYIAAYADSIYADRTTITGSIGIFAMIPNIQNFLKNKLGVTQDGVESVPNSNLDMFSPLTETQKNLIQRMIIDGYDNFKQQVSLGRKLEFDIVEDVAQGRVWHAEGAKQNYLVDKFGGIQDAIDAVSKMSKTTDYSIVEYPKPSNMVELLAQTLSGASSSKSLEPLFGKNVHEVIRHLENMDAIQGKLQTRLPFNYYIE